MHAIARKTAVLAFLALQALAAAAWAQSAGRIDFAAGIVRIERGGQVLAGIRGTQVLEGDVIVTGPDTQVQIRMTDDAFLALRPNTRLTLDKYRFGRSRDEDGVVLTLAHGIMRAFTGAIAAGNRDRFLMKTPLATVGIRGSGNILAHLGGEGTVNHTITGAHSITAFDELGRPVTVITRPGQTVQVRPGAPPRFVPTPSYIFAAASSAPPAQVAATSTSTTSGPGGSSGGGGGGGGDSSGGSASSGGTSSGGTSSGGSGDPSAAGASGSSASTGTGAASLPSGTGASTGTSSSPSSNVQTAVAPANVRTPGTGGTSSGTAQSIAIAGNLVNPNGGRAGLLANDMDPGYGVVTLNSAGVLTDASHLYYSHPPGGEFPTFPGGTFTDATVRLTGATPSDYFRNVEQDIILGRLQGPTIDVTGIACSCDVPESRTDTTGTGSVAFVAYNETPRGVILSYTGTTEYRLDGSTRPADSHGNLGTVNNASMQANFTDRTLDFTFSLAVNNLVYTASGSGVYFDSVRFNAGNPDGQTPGLTITCAGSGCAPSYRAAVNGAFAGTATTAWLVYHIFPADFTDLVNGAMAFSAVTAPLPRFALPATGTWNMVMIDNYIGTGPGFPTFNTSASANINFSTRRADFTFNFDRVLTPADVQAGFQPQTVTASAANLPMQGVGFEAQTGIPRRPSNLNVTCTGCGSAAPVGRFEGYLSYVDPGSTGGNVNIYWYLTNNTSGTLGYDYNGSSYFGNAPTPPVMAVATAAAVAPTVRLSTLPDGIRGLVRRPR